MEQTARERVRWEWTGQQLEADGRSRYDGCASSGRRLPRGLRSSSAGGDCRQPSPCCCGCLLRRWPSSRCPKLLASLTTCDRTSSARDHCSSRAASAHLRDRGRTGDGALLSTKAAPPLRPGTRGSSGMRAVPRARHCGPRRNWNSGCSVTQPRSSQVVPELGKGAPTQFVREARPLALEKRDVRLLYAPSQRPG